MANWHARDVCGCLLLLLVFTEGARKWVTVTDLSTDVRTKQMAHIQNSALHQVARRLLTPVKPGSRLPALCQNSEQECEEGVSVTCMQGNVIGCSCDFIAVCYPQVSRCSRFNSTHTESCGF